MTPRLLVTGSTGFIGSHTIPILKRMGYHISESHGTDLSDHNQVKQLVERTHPSHLLHLAWDVSGDYINDVSKNDKWACISMNLIKEFVRQGGQRITIAGTQRNPEVNKTPYGFWKNELNKWCLEFCSDEGVSYSNGRIFYVYGVNEKPGRLVPYIINMLLDGNEPKTSNKAIDILSSKEVASALCHILDSGIAGSVDIGTGVVTPIPKIVNDLRYIIHGEKRETSNEFTPSFAAYTKPLSTTGWVQGNRYLHLQEAVDYWRSVRAATR